jgi:hypothetical protein
VVDGETAQRVVPAEPGWSIPQDHVDEIEGT